MRQHSSRRISSVSQLPTQCSDFISLQRRRPTLFHRWYPEAISFDSTGHDLASAVAKSLALSNPSDVTDEDVGDASIIVGLRRYGTQ